MWASLVVSLAVLLPLANANYGPIGNCTANMVNTYISKLPDPDGCGQAYLTLLSPVGVAQDNYNNAIATFCTPQCGQTIAEFSTVECGELGRASGFGFLLYCLPRETGNDRCRSSFPDLVDQAFVQNLTLCLNFTTECPAGCAATLNWGTSLFGCCYQSIYNDSDALALIGQLGMTDVEVIEAVQNPALWSACNVPLTSFCTGIAFPGEPFYGVCNRTRFGAIVASTDASCNKTYNTISSRPPNLEELLDDLCRADCAGEIAESLDEMCEDQITSTLTRENCQRTEGTLGPRCFYSSGTAFRNARIFDDAGNTCFQPGDSDSCPTGCASGLTKIISNLGCCYQTIYNDTTSLHGLYIDGEIPLAYANAIEGLRSQELWNRCDVPIQPRCTGDPYAPAAGALKFAASMMTVMSVIMLSLIL